MKHKVILSILALIVFAACKERKKPVITTLSSPNPVNFQLEDSAIALIKPGDIVFRLGNDITSYMLSQLNFRDKSFSHCGFAVVENGKTYIIHSIGGEFNPDQKIKKEPAKKWFSPENNLSLGIARWNMNNDEKQKLTSEIEQYYKEGKKFDLNFDINTDDRLYCAEMIYKAAILSTHNSSYLPITSIFNKKYVGVDDLFLNPHTTMICRLRYK